MSAREIAGLLRLLAVTIRDVHRACRLYFAEDRDRYEARKAAR